MDEYLGFEVQGVVGNFFEYFGELLDGYCCFVVFFGGMIGNLCFEIQVLWFLQSFVDVMNEGDLLFIGIDCIKDLVIIEVVYNDLIGVIVEFNFNVLCVINCEFDVDFVFEQFVYCVFFCFENCWIEMCFVLQCVQMVCVGVFDVEFEFVEGEEILIEISVKYDCECFELFLGQSGFELFEWMMDEKGLFVFLFVCRV